MKTTIGTCGNCGGPVTVPSVWHGVIHPTPKCDRCGATPREAFGPVMEMGPTPIVGGNDATPPTVGGSQADWPRSKR